MALSPEERIAVVKANFERENDILSNWENDSREFVGPGTDQLEPLNQVFAGTWIDYMQDVRSANITIVEICKRFQDGEIDFNAAKDEILEDQYNRGGMRRYANSNGPNPRGRYLNSIRDVLGLEVRFANILEAFLETGDLPADWQSMQDPEPETST